MFKIFTEISKLVVVNWFFLVFYFVVKIRGNDDTIGGWVADRAAAKVKVAEEKFSQLWAGRVVPTGSHLKWLAEWFCASRGIYHRVIILDE